MRTTPWPIYTDGTLPGQPERAVQILGAAKALREATGMRLPAYVRAVYERYVAAIRAGLGGDELFAANWAEGQSMGWEEAVAYALLPVDPVAGTHSVSQGLSTGRSLPDLNCHVRITDSWPAGQPAGLTPRETDVLRLLAAGLSNKEIARKLGVAVSTVNNHLNNIYDKISGRGRVAAAAYALRTGLAEP